MEGGNSEGGGREDDGHARGGHRLGLAGSRRGPNSVTRWPVHCPTQGTYVVHILNIGVAVFFHGVVLIRCSTRCHSCP